MSWLYRVEGVPFFLQVGYSFECLEKMCVTLTIWTSFSTEKQSPQGYWRRFQKTLTRSSFSGRKESSRKVDLYRLHELYPNCIKKYNSGLSEDKFIFENKFLSESITFFFRWIKQEALNSLNLEVKCTIYCCIFTPCSSLCEHVSENELPSKLLKMDRIIQRQHSHTSLYINSLLWHTSLPLKSWLTTFNTSLYWSGPLKVTLNLFDALEKRTKKKPFYRFKSTFIV